ncbi:hypothetical protein Daus18300_005165 [Diaporthe australafricana]|uniref:Uncharacterized protein n=1 Tax=Diaporthe australafricana TaxID=127596 RepID=A0ABR3X464_9PEZI
MHNHSPNRASRPNRPWQDGDIAFLQDCNRFHDQDYKELIASGYIQPKATSHPVIILQAGPGRAIVTPVSAYSSGPQVNFCPPRRMSFHREKHLDDFHAFNGTELPPKTNHSHLRLSDPGAKMNKPKASWVYVKSFWTVPDRVLLRWNSVPGRLQVSQESLEQLRGDIERKYSTRLRDAKFRLTTSSMAAESPRSTTTSSARQAPRHTMDQHSRSAVWKPQQGAFPKTTAPAFPTRPAAMRSSHSSARPGAARPFITNTSWRQAISAAEPSIPPAMHSWRRPIVA